jgi:hypothetical protein
MDTETYSLEVKWVDVGAKVGVSPDLSANRTFGRDSILLVDRLILASPLGQAKC